MVFVTSNGGVLCGINCLMSRPSNVHVSEVYETRCRPDGTKLYWPAVQCYRGLHGNTARRASTATETVYG